MASLLLAVSAAAANSTLSSTSLTDSLLPFTTFSYLLLIALITAPTLWLVSSRLRPVDASLPPTFSYLLPTLRGSFHLKQSGPIELLHAGYRALGECYRMQVLNKGFTVMIGPDANQLVFEAKDSILSQQEIYSFTVPVFGSNVVYDAPRPVMQQQLRFTAQGLNTFHMERHADKIVNEAEMFFSKWPASGEVDLLDAFSKLIILTASRCLLGDEIRDHVHEEFAELYQTLSDGMSHISVFWPNAPIESHRKRDQARAAIKKIFEPIIIKRRAETPEEAATHLDFLQVLIDSRYTDGSSASNEDIVGLLIAALFGGQHTSNITSTWMGFHMIKDKAILQRCLSEQEEVLAKYNGRLTYAALNEMQLLSCTMKETLRMYPPLILLMRTALEPIQFKNYTIPKGDIVVVVPPVTHRLDQIYSNPNQWDPDRFFVRKEDKVKFSFISFGGGRHGCLGQQFAFLQVKSIWSTLMRQFDFEFIPNSKFPEIDYSAIVAGPKSPCTVRFQRKTDAFKITNF